MIGKVKRLFALLSTYRPLWELLYVTALPLFLTHNLVYDIWRAGRPRAWDGSGHYGIAQIYAQSIFPDTFGWTTAHFGGMPFPNFYPPLFFWCVALLNRAHLFSFLTAFKLLVLLPLLLIPAAIWLLARSVSNNNPRVAFLAALVSVYPLLSSRFGGQTQWASGLDYFSTLSIGMYTQPLGFVLLLAWYANYVKEQYRVWRFALTSILLALAVLANFLNGIMAVIVIASTLFFDLLHYRRLSLKTAYERSDVRGLLLTHVLSPLVSAGLTLFWVVPMLGTYEYFVTRPFTLVIFTSDMAVWFVLAGLGVACWLYQPTPAMKPYLMACCALAVILLTAATFAPRWLPLQANRFSPTLYFLLSVLVAYLVSTVYERTKQWLFQRFPRRKPLAARVATFVWGGILLGGMVNYYFVSQTPNVKFFYKYQAMLACYPSPEAAAVSPAVQAPTPPGPPVLPEPLREKKPADLTSDDLIETLKREHPDDEASINAAAATLNGVLSFAREHRDGRYLVEIPAQYRTDAASFDGRALNSYLGAQGNETLTVVYREASPNSVFMFPQVGALSFNPDNFGFSSILGDDIDFSEQPTSKHLERVRFLGGRYLVINSQQMKDRLAQEPAVGARYDYGKWSIFELREAPPPAARVLPYRPALLVSEFTVKGRRQNERNYIRYAEEQFADGWFDVLLVRAPTTKLDQLGTQTELNQFGAIILDTYDCVKCDIVYRQLKDFAQHRPLILLMRDATLFNRIRYALDDFPMARIVEREPDDAPGAWLDNLGATRRYGSRPVRREWAEIRRILQENKTPTEAVTVSGEFEEDSIRLSIDAATTFSESGVPVLIATTYHPNWQADNAQTVYAADPMFMLTFARKPVRLTFARRWSDRLGVCASACTLLGLSGFTVWYYLGRRNVVRNGGGRAEVPEVARH
ncbi:MAG: hypothetical protein ACJ754_05840 [Pyrinomonadaceae bacterium]